MQKSAGSMPSYHGPPPAAPPSYSQAVGGVQPSCPYTPMEPAKPHGSIVQNTPVIMTTVVPVGDQPTHMICPHCRNEVVTATRKEPGIVAYISGIIIAAMGFICGCCLIPCCIDSCMDVHHTCPFCQSYLGRFRR